LARPVADSGYETVDEQVELLSPGSVIGVRPETVVTVPAQAGWDLDLDTAVWGTVDRIVGV
tara:strand:+ start:769 stop:951 length:183 start_codon:yes stop_codon:yes gene_type:complete